MTNEIKNQEYFVPQIQCAAWLVLCGFEILRIEQNGKHKQHYFENTKQLQSHISMYKSGEYYSPEFAEVVSQIKAMPTVKI